MIVPLKYVTFDKGYDSEENHRFVIRDGREIDNTFAMGEHSSK